MVIGDGFPVRVGSSEPHPALSSLAIAPAIPTAVQTHQPRHLAAPIELGPAPSRTGLGYSGRSPRRAHSPRARPQGPDLPTDSALQRDRIDLVVRPAHRQRPGRLARRRGRWRPPVRTGKPHQGVGIADGSRRHRRPTSESVRPSFRGCRRQRRTLVQSDRWCARQPGCMPRRGCPMRSRMHVKAGGRHEGTEIELWKSAFELLAREAGQPIALAGDQAATALRMRRPAVPRAMS